MDSLNTGLRGEMRDHLYRVILPFWEGLADWDRGGFTGYVGYDLLPRPEKEKGCILHARILWFFSTALRVTGDASLKKYADHAYEALKRMEDADYGGFYWSVTPDLTPLDTTKHTYCQAFAVYGLAAYAQAADCEEALETARRTYRLMEAKCRDEKGYLEAFKRDFSPESNEKLSENGVSAARTMNTLLHVMEGYTELYRVAGDRDVRACLTEQFALWEKHMYNPSLRRQEVFFGPEYESLIDLTSYGHDIETSWLLDRTLEILDDPALTGRVRPKLLSLAEAVLEEAVTADNGCANEKERGKVDEKRIWWVQAEALLGCLNAWHHTGRADFLRAAWGQWTYICGHIWDHRKGGEWFWCARKDGTPMEKPIVEPWKCPYHNGRMTLEVIGRREYEDL